MDWEGANLASLLAWLEKASTDTYAGERRLDPLATSMRDFDDVSEDLRRLRNNFLPDRNDPGQRIADLRGAKLVEAKATALSPLGHRTLSGWERHGVANSEIHDELGRHLILLCEAVKAGDLLYATFLDYWLKLRDRFSPFDLIDSWDALYTLNYLDCERADYRPGDRYHQEAESIEEIKFDLNEVALSGDGGSQAMSGAERIKRAVEGKVPRGRHRATFCSALEVMAGGADSLDIVLENFGVPKKPRIWSALNEDRKTTIREIAKDYGLLESASDVSPREEGQRYLVAQEYAEHWVGVLDADDFVYVPMDDERQLVLPEKIDFHNALVNLPQVVSDQPAAEGRERATKGSKVDHIRKAFVNKTIGDLGEEFAIRFERWRLREQPDLKEKIRHVSRKDDSAGYDILSFEDDGTPRFVEVKSTLGPLDSPFFISARELEMAEENKDKYVILRVFDVKVSPKCCEIRFPFDEAIDLSPSTFIATFS